MQHYKTYPRRMTELPPEVMGKIQKRLRNSRTTMKARTAVATSIHGSSDAFTKAVSQADGGLSIVITSAAQRQASLDGTNQHLPKTSDGHTPRGLG